MTDDKNIVHLPKRNLAAEMRASPSSGQSIPVNLPEGLPQIETGALGFTDMNAAFNMRAWLQKACEAAGGKMTGGGFGGGCADLWIELEGHEYMVSIKPVRR